MTDADFVLGEVPRIMDESYKNWYKDSRELLKYPQEIISFIDSCNFTCDQLSRIARAIEDMKWSDYYEEESTEDMFDRTQAQNGQY